MCGTTSLKHVFGVNANIKRYDPLWCGDPCRDVVYLLTKVQEPKKERAARYEPAVEGISELRGGGREGGTQATVTMTSS